MSHRILSPGFVLRFCLCFMAGFHGFRALWDKRTAACVWARARALFAEGYLFIYRRPAMTLPARATAAGYLKGAAAVAAAKRMLARPGTVGIDFETSIAPPLHRKAYVLSLAREGRAIVCWLGDQAPIMLPEIFGGLAARPAWDDETVLVAHNALFEVEVLAKHGVPLDVECTMIAAKCLYFTAVPEDVPQPVEFSLAALVERAFHERRDKSIRERDWSQEDSLDQEGVDYCRQDAVDTLRLWRFYSKELRDLDLWPGYRIMQQAILPSAEINLAGKLFDRGAHDKLCRQLREDLADLNFDLDRICQRAIVNHGSAPQVSDWIIEEVLGIRQLARPEPPKHVRLQEFVRREGGVRPDAGGEVAARDLPARLVKLTGLGIDELALRAWEAGYFIGEPVRPADPERVLDMLAEDVHHGPVLPEREHGEWQTHLERVEAHEETLRWRETSGVRTKAELLGKFDRQLRARIGGGWRWTAKTGNLKINRAAMLRRPPVLRPHWPAIADYLEVRARWNLLRKRHDVYGPKLADRVDLDGRFRGQYRVMAAVTGRQSSSGGEHQIPAEPSFRALFKAPPGRKLVICDYGQIELRLMAIASNDKALLEIYREGRDVHDETMAITKVPTRRLAKNINFCVCYGGGAAGLSENCGIPLDEAETFLARFLEHYQGVARYRERAMSSRIDHISIRPNRRVLIDPTIDVQGPIYVNYPIQGGAASVQMKALRLVRDKIIDAKIDAFIVGSIHDELLVESDYTCAPAASDVVQTEMRRALLSVFPEAADMRAADLAEASVVDNWSQKE